MLSFSVVCCDATLGGFVNMMKKGIIDPTKIARISLLGGKEEKDPGSQWNGWNQRWYVLIINELWQDVWDNVWDNFREVSWKWLKKRLSDI